jgi:hypothetical protein
VLLLAKCSETWKVPAMRCSTLSILVPTAALVFGPACGDDEGASNSSATTASGGATSTASATGSTSGTTSATTSTGDVDPTGGDPVTSSATSTGAVDPPTTGDTTTSGDTTIDSATGDSTTGETTIESTTGDASTGEDGTTGIGGEADVLYVREDGQDGNPGTVDLPLRTIQWAIDRAGHLGTIDTIRVAQGDYAIDYANADHIVMAAGVSLYGGYRADWSERDPAQYVTRIVDETPVALPSSETDPHRAIEIPADVSGDTVLDGFHVGVARGFHRAALFVQGDPTIRNNVIEPVVDEDSVTIFGVRVDEGHPAVVANRIRFVVLINKGQTAEAISAVGSNGLFAANVIDLSGPLLHFRGLRLSSGAAKILANSVYLQRGNAIYLTESATPIVDNNLIECADPGLTATGIFSINAATVPSVARSNVLNCKYALYGHSPNRVWETVMEFEAGLANATDNLKLAQSVIGPDDDMVLDAQSPCTVTQGGRDITADVPDDIDGVVRTPPLSIGAHEWDGGCL